MILKSAQKSSFIQRDYKLMCWRNS